MMLDFDQQLRLGGENALKHIGSFAMGTDPVHETMFRAAKRLNELAIPYSVCGGMAMALHGYVRATVTVDLLVSRDGLESVHANLDGRGYVPPFAGSKQLRDAETGVRVEFLVAGGFPGNGMPKPVTFPDPSAAGIVVEKDGLKVLSLETLIELKLASGMTAGHRLKDLADVQQLIEVLNLDERFADRLNPYVREKYQELWLSLRSARPEWDEPSRQ